MNILKTTEQFKRVNFMVCELYLNKADKKKINVISNSFPFSKMSILVYCTYSDNKQFYIYMCACVCVYIF